MNILNLYVLMSLFTVTLHAKIQEKLNILDIEIPMPVELTSCTGVYVGPKTVLTAGHCVEGLYKKQAWVKVGDRSYSVSVIASSEIRDLALLRVAGPEHEYVRLGKEVKIGDDLYSVHSGEDMPGTYGKGYVANIINDPSNNQPLIEHTVPILHGSSGSGLFSSDGKLVGINIAIFKGGSIAVAVPLSTIRQFMKDHE